VDLHAAGGAVKDELAEAPFEFGLRLQEFEPKHLRRDGDLVICGEAGVHRLVNEVARVRRLFGDRRDRSLRGWRGPAPAAYG
jgi:hypothetical protein